MLEPESATRLLPLARDKGVAVYKLSAGIGWLPNARERDRLQAYIHSI